MNGSFQPSKQRGTALITVVLIAAVVIVMVIESVKSLKTQKQLSSNLINRDQAYSYLMGMEELAKIYLRKAFEQLKEENVHLNQPWAQDDITFPIDGGGMTASLRDMQSCFNLNAILTESQDQGGGRGSGPNAGGNNAGGNNAGVNRSGGQSPNNINDDAVGRVYKGQEVLEELIEKVKTDSAIIGKDLATAYRDWVDDDFIEAGPSGAEDNFYQGLEIPYRTANGLIAHESELRAIKGFNRDIYQALRPYICVLPDKSVNQVNVNTVTEETVGLLVALIDSRSISESEINKAISERPEEGYTSVEKFLEAIGPVDGAAIDQSLLTVTSNYFQMSAKAEIGNTRVAMKTLFKRDEDNNFKVVSRYYGRE